MKLGVVDELSVVYRCAATRSVKELVVVVSTEKPKSTFTDYRKQTLFGCLKSRGFDYGINSHDHSRAYG